MEKKYKVVAGVLLSLTLLTGCAGGNQKATNEKANNKSVAQVENKNGNKDTTQNKSEEITLADWEGSWNSIEGYLGDDALKDAFKVLAQKEKVSEAEAKENYIKKRHADFKGMKIDGNKVTLYDNFEDKNGKEIETVEYEYTNQHKVKHDNYDLEWDVFKAKDANAKYPVLLMMPVHGEEELIHFHMRYGNDENKLLEEEGWYPTFVKPSSTMEQIAEEVAE